MMCYVNVVDVGNVIIHLVWLPMISFRPALKFNYEVVSLLRLLY